MSDTPLNTQQEVIRNKKKNNKILFKLGGMMKETKNENEVKNN